MSDNTAQDTETLYQQLVAKMQDYPTTDYIASLDEVKRALGLME